MTTSWMFLLAVGMALCGFAVVIGVMVVLFRAASRSVPRPPGNPGAQGIPPVLGDDRLTNPAHPLYPGHHATSMSDDFNRHFSADSGAGHSPFDSSSSSSASSDSGSSSSSSDSGGSGCG